MRAGLGPYSAFMKKVKDRREWLRVAFSFSLHFIDLLPFTIALSHSVSQATECALDTRVYAHGHAELGTISMSCSAFTISAIQHDISFPSIYTESSREFYPHCKISCLALRRSAISAVLKSAVVII